MPLTLDRAMNLITEQNYFVNMYKRLSAERERLEPAVKQAYDCDAQLSITMELYSLSLLKENPLVYGAWLRLSEPDGSGGPQLFSVWRTREEALDAAHRQRRSGWEEMMDKCGEAVPLVNVSPNLVRVMALRELRDALDDVD